MPGVLNHSQSDIIQQLLINMGLGTDPELGQAWPVYSTVLPDMPDQLLLVMDTEAVGHGRSQVDGERQEHHGVQVVVRSSTHRVGYAKARSIATTLDTGVYLDTVTLDGSSYTIHSMNRTSDVLILGYEKPETLRRLFTINFLTSLRSA